MKVEKQYVKLFLLILFLHSLFSAYPINQDSLLTKANSTIPATEKHAILMQLGHHYKNQNPDSAQTFVRKALSAAYATKQDTLTAPSYLLLGDIYYKQRQLDSAYHHFNKSKQQYQKTKIIDKVLLVNRRLGYTLRDQGLWEKANTCFMRNATLADSTSQLQLKAIALNNVGETFRLQKNKANNLKYMQMAAELIKSIDYPVEEWTVRHNYALALDLNGDQESAINEFRALIPLADSLNSITRKAAAYQNLGRLYAKTKKLNLAKAALDTAMSIPQWMNNKGRSLAVRKEMGTVYYDMGKLNAAADLMLQVYKESKSLNMYSHLEDATRNLSDIYAAKGEHKKALTYHKEYVQLLFNIFDEETNDLLAKMDAQYRTAEKDKSILKLEGEKRLAENKQRMLIWGIIILLVMAGLAVALLIQSLHNRKKKQQLSEAKLQIADGELLRKQSELNHFADLLKEKNDLIEQFEKELTTSDIPENKRIEKLQTLLDAIILTEDDWETFKSLFEQVYPNFFAKLKYEFPDITVGEMRMTALMKLKLPNKEVGRMLGISADSVKKAKTRLRKKLEMVDMDGLVVLVDTL